MLTTYQKPLCLRLWCVGRRFESQLGRKAKNSATDSVILKATGSMLKHQPAQVSSHLLMWCEPLEKKPLIPLINASLPKPLHLFSDVILPCSVMYWKGNKCKNSAYRHQTSVADPWHFCVDPDLDPWIHASDNGSGSFYFHHWPSRWQQKIFFFYKVFLLITFWRYRYF